MADTARDPRLEQDLLKSDIFRFFPNVSVKLCLLLTYWQANFLPGFLVNIYTDTLFKYLNHSGCEIIYSLINFPIEQSRRYRH